MSTRMSPLDAVWLMMESADTPMHVGVLAIFNKPRNAPKHYLSDWAAKMREVQVTAEPWSLLVSRGPSLLGPRLEEDQDFDVEYHFRHSALPEPGGERELGVMVSRLHSHPLDPSRPLWEFHLIEGLERDRFAFYVKVHHALVDNVNGIPMLLAMLSDNARTRSMPPLWAKPLDSGGALTGDDDRRSIPDSGDVLESVSNVIGGAARNLFRRGEEGSFLLPSGCPRSTLNRHINAQRRFATQQFEQSRIQTLADATDSTLNEILTYLCGSSLRRFFKEYNALPDESLVGALPVSLQERSESLPGNAIAGLRVALGTHIGDPIARLDAVKDSMHKVREDRASLPDAAVTSYVMTRAAPLYASQLPFIGRLVPPLFNLVVSNTPGPDKPRYFNGARLEAIYPMSPLMQFSALSIDCVSYAGTLNIGFTGARDTLPHLQRLAVYLGRALEDLEELVAEGEVTA
jgi:WS/DGAT/MGAT family acyltransferase